MARILLSLWLMLASTVRAGAGTGSLFVDQGQAATPLVQQAALLDVSLTSQSAARATTNPGASLFAGAGLGMFAPVVSRAPQVEAAALYSLPLPPGPSRARHLLDLIARAEAGRAGYDAVQHGARIKPIAPPTKMTLGQIDAWIRATPGQPHAIGRYQFIPKTLRRLAGELGYGPEVRFTPEVQDRLAMVLLADAGIVAFEKGDLSRTRFMKNLARIWAGLPLPNGKSYYHGHAGNKATMSWTAFSEGVARIWPVEG